MTIQRATPGSIQLTGKEAFNNRMTAALAVGLPALATLVGIALVAAGIMPFAASDLAIFAGMYAISGLGVTVGMHRLFTHRSFEASRGTQAVLAVMGIMALQGNVSGWVATHRRHHRYSDQEGDMHSPVPMHHGFKGALRALWHVHFGRLFMAEDTSVSMYASDIVRNPMLVKIDRLAGLWIALTLALPALAGWLVQGGVYGAFSGLFWGGLVRIFIGQNIGSCVNSLCHMWGTTLFKTGDASKNNLFVGLAAFGEGWHNNHHAFPASAKQGMLWWQLDLSYWVIVGLKSLGLAWNVKVPSAEMMSRRKLQAEVTNSTEDHEVSLGEPVIV